ncbi:hypothetical protein VTO73DRAFT_3986 [Trametes versicolor]
MRSEAPVPNRHRRSAGSERTQDRRRKAAQESKRAAARRPLRRREKRSSAAAARLGRRLERDNGTEGAPGLCSRSAKKASRDGRGDSGPIRSRRRPEGVSGAGAAENGTSGVSSYDREVLENTAYGSVLGSATARRVAVQGQLRARAETSGTHAGGTNNRAGEGERARTEHWLQVPKRRSYSTRSQAPEESTQGRRRLESARSPRSHILIRTSHSNTSSKTSIESSATSEHEEGDGGGEQQAGGGVETSEARLWARER